MSLLYLACITYFNILNACLSNVMVRFHQNPGYPVWQFIIIIVLKPTVFCQYTL